MKPIWIVTISCFLITNAMRVNAIQAAAATPTPDSGCGANSATGGCVYEKKPDTKAHHHHGAKKTKKSKKSTERTPAPAASPSPK
jgi:hypothetical protein